MRELFKGVCLLIDEMSDWLKGTGTDMETLVALFGVYLALIEAVLLALAFVGVIGWTTALFLPLACTGFAMLAAVLLYLIAREWPK